MEKLTKKQQKILNFIEKRLRDNKPPSQREIAEHFDLAQNAIYQLISYLKKKGYLENRTGHRALRLSKAYLDKTRRGKGLPLVGRVAAGEPILAEQNIEGYIDLKKLFNPSDGSFLLKIVGDSMVDEGIMNGDYVMVKPTPTIENGQIGVVLLDDEATVKRIYIQKDKIALKPANQAAGYKTRYVKRGDKSIRIIGRVAGCFKLL